MVPNWLSNSLPQPTFRRAGICSSFATSRNAGTQKSQEPESLALARSAWREADALRKATLALTEDLRMNSVLDTLLKTLYPTRAL